MMQARSLLSKKEEAKPVAPKVEKPVEVKAEPKKNETPVAKAEVKAEPKVQADSVSTNTPADLLLQRRKKIMACSRPRMRRKS